MQQSTSIPMENIRCTKNTIGAWSFIRMFRLIPSAGHQKFQDQDKINTLHFNSHFDDDNPPKSTQTKPFTTDTTNQLTKPNVMSTTDDLEQKPCPTLLYTNDDNNNRTENTWATAGSTTQKPWKTRETVRPLLRKSWWFVGSALNNSNYVRELHVQ
jgi:hypothetical protein